MSDWTYIPIVQSRGARTPRTLETSYGGGYEQRSADGINATLQTWNVQFQDTKANAGAMDTFLKTRAGYQSFTWTPAYPWDTEIRVKCKQWDWTFDGGDIMTLNAVFEEVVNIALTGYTLPGAPYASDDFENYASGDRSVFGLGQSGSDVFWSAAGYILPAVYNYGSQEFEILPSGVVTGFLGELNVGDTSIFNGGLVLAPDNWGAQDFESLASGTVTSLSGEQHSGDTSISTASFVT